MTAHLSSAMKKARAALQKDPATPRAALAKRLGLTRDALYKDAVCKSIIEQFNLQKNREK